MRKLQVSFSRKEKVERLLNNLENLKNESSIEQSQYQLLKENYSRILNDSIAEIRNIKASLETEVQQEEYRSGAYAQELTNLEARFRVGELSVDQHIKMRESAQRKLEKARGKIDELKRLINAESASQIGGYLDVPIERKAKELALPGLSDTKVGELFQNILSGGIGRILAIVAVVLMVLGCFIPWASFLGFSVSPVEVGKSGWIGAALLLLTAGCLGLLFVGSSAKRGLGYLVCGVIAFVIVLVEFFQPVELLRIPAGKFLSIGFYIFAIGCLLAIVGGILEMKAGGKKL